MPCLELFFRTLPAAALRPLFAMPRSRLVTRCDIRGELILSLLVCDTESFVKVFVNFEIQSSE